MSYAPLDQQSERVSEDAVSKADHGQNGTLAVSVHWRGRMLLLVLVFLLVGACTCVVAMSLFFSVSLYSTIRAIDEASLLCCLYGAASYPGFWVVDRMLYMHYELGNRCQLRPFAPNLHRLSIERSERSNVQPPAEPAFNVTTLTDALLPYDWPASKTLLSSYLAEYDGLERLRGQVVLTIGDSLDFLLMKAVCSQIGADAYAVIDSTSEEYFSLPAALLPFVIGEFYLVTRSPPLRCVKCVVANRAGWYYAIHNATRSSASRSAILAVTRFENQ